MMSIMSMARTFSVRAFFVRASLVSAAVAVGACVVVQDLGSTSDGGALSLDASADARLGEAGSEPNEASTSDGSVSDGGVTPPIDGPTGPGPLGALPSGYCCTSDDECRFRKCVDLGSGKMCVDACSASRPFCDRPGVDLDCKDLGGQGLFCQPPGAFACLDPATFVRGTKGTGSCCPDTQDGMTGSHCEAYLCLAIGTNPWFCTRRCDGDGDCPADHRCAPVADRKQCLPRATPYLCK